MIIPSLLLKLVMLILIQNKERKSVRIVINQEEVMSGLIFTHSFLVDCLILANSYAFLFECRAQPVDSFNFQDSRDDWLHPRLNETLYLEIL